MRKEQYRTMKEKELILKRRKEEGTVWSNEGEGSGIKEKKGRNSIRAKKENELVLKRRKEGTLEKTYLYTRLYKFSYLNSLFLQKIKNLPFFILFPTP
jgi:hypothetical protein